MTKDLTVVYTVLITEKADCVDYPYRVDIPAFDGTTEGQTLADAIYMARDYIGLMAVDYCADHRELPADRSITQQLATNQMKTLVDVNVDAYRRKNSLRTVKKTLSIPSYLNEAGIAANLNFSELLTVALKDRLDA